MPSSITVSHNGLEITFTESDHTYIDSNRKRYTSVTTLVGMGFERFDMKGNAIRVAEKQGRHWMDVVKEWEANRKMAAGFGTRLHENCEHQILGQMELLHEAKIPSEKINFDLAYKAVEDLKKNYHNIKFEPEKLVFSPKLGIAGSIDLLVTKDDGTYHIYDWKNVKNIAMEGFRGKCGILECTKDVQDSNYWHYNLQLQLYEIILKVEGYIPKNAKVRRTLNTFQNGQIIQYDLEPIGEVAKNMIKWLNTPKDN